MDIVTPVRVLLIFCSLVFTSFGVNAKCYANQGGAVSQTFTITTSNVIAQRDAPVGTVIGDFWDSGSGIIESCDSEQPSGYYTEMVLFPTKSSIEFVYNTNVEGVGLQLGNSLHFTNPASFYGVSGGSLYFGNHEMFIVKTGNIKSGIINGGLLARVYGNGDMVNGAVWQFPSTTVIQVACSITTPKMVFPLGTVPASEFGTNVGYTSTETNTQNLGLNCDAEANINVMLNGEQNPDVSDTSVLALTGQGGQGVASGLGVQLVYNGKPLGINSRIVMKRSEGGVEMLPITARYYQTKPAVTAGEASTSATLALTYQ